MKGDNCGRAVKRARIRNSWRAIILAVIVSGKCYKTVLSVILSRSLFPLTLFPDKIMVNRLTGLTRALRVNIYLLLISGNERGGVRSGDFPPVVRACNATSVPSRDEDERRVRLLNPVACN